MNSCSSAISARLAGSSASKGWAGHAGTSPNALQGRPGQAAQRDSTGDRHNAIHRMCDGVEHLKPVRVYENVTTIHLIKT